jgi:hypothetical protein
MASRAESARRRKRFAYACCLAPIAFMSGRAHAQEPATVGDYSIDLSQGPVLSASRVTGLAGAVTAIAEGMEGGLSNPAASAVRTAASADFWDYWVALSLTYPFDNGDFYNSGNLLSDSGKGDSDSFFFLNTGGYLQLYGLGFGLNVEILQVVLRSSEMSGAAFHLQLITTHMQAGYLFFDGQLAVGGGLQVLRTRAVAEGADDERQKLQAQVGFGGEAGVLLRPNGAQWRIGAGFYSLVKTQYPADEVVMLEGQELVLPKYAVRPWRGNVGGAYQFGKRPLNPRFSYVEEKAGAPLLALEARRQRAQREHAQRRRLLARDTSPEGRARLAREEREFAEQELVFDAERDAIRKEAWRELRAGVRTRWERRYILLTGEISLNGRVDNGVGIESFLAQTVQRSGEKVTVTPRIGVESEVWPTHLKVRAGCYYEATRFRETSARVHGTLGLDVRLFNWDVFRIWPEDYLWQLTSAVDISRDYQAFSLGIGGWY